MLIHVGREDMTNFYINVVKPTMLVMEDCLRSVISPRRISPVVILFLSLYYLLPQQVDHDKNLKNYLICLSKSISRDWALTLGMG
jgi:hypothetical protein